MAPHPARYSDAILQAVESMGLDNLRVLDPFAGVGGLRRVLPNATLVELERGWATHIVGDARRLPFARDSFDAIVTSPCYGNRLADHHNARDGAVRHSYTHDLGRRLRPESSGELYFWQSAYKSFHVSAWGEALRVLCPGGIFVLNISNFIRNGQEQFVSEWHLETLEGMGCHLMRDYQIGTPRMRYGANGNARVEFEHIMVFRGPMAPA